MMEKLTLEERIAQAARSQAASPEAAAKLVQRLAQLYTGDIFHECADLELMYGLIGPYMDQVGDDLLHYAGFCHSINLAFTADVPQGEVAAPFRPALGVRASNAVVLLGLMLLDHAKGKRKDKEVYHCTRMTLEQYLDALETLAFPEDEAAGQAFRRWRKGFLRFRDPSAPLADVLESLLRQYIHGWQPFDCLDHVLRCMEELSAYLEKERTEALDREFREIMRQAISDMGISDVEVVEEDEREQYPDPGRHYMDLAHSYSWDLPDPAAGLREQIFLPGRDFSPASLEAMAEGAPTPEFRMFLEELLSAQLLSISLSEVNDAVYHLFMLWVGPYLWIEKRLR